MLATLAAATAAPPVLPAAPGRPCPGRPPEGCLEAGCALALRVRRWLDAMEPPPAPPGRALRR